MPLEPGSSRATIGHNIEEMEQSGHPQKQAVAAALREAGVSNTKDAPAQPPEHKAPEPPGKEMRAPTPEGEEMPGMPVPVTKDTLAGVNKKNRAKWG